MRGWTPGAAPRARHKDAKKDEWGDWDMESQAFDEEARPRRWSELLPAQPSERLRRCVAIAAPPRPRAAR